MLESGYQQTNTATTYIISYVVSSVDCEKALELFGAFPIAHCVMYYVILFVTISNGWRKFS
jgi:hypothetical protein